MKKIFLSILLFAQMTAFAEVTQVTDVFKNFDKKFSDKKAGTLRLNYDYGGEPVISPSTIKVFVKCAGEKKEREIFSTDACTIKSYEYTDKTLFFRVQKGRVDESSKVWCDQYSEESIKIEEACKLTASKK